MAEPQVLRLRLAQKGRQPALRMTSLLLKEVMGRNIRVVFLKFAAYLRISGLKSPGLKASRKPLISWG
jgi:hypothetical protein